MTNFCSIDPSNPFENQKNDYFASTFAAKPSFIYLYYNSLCLKMFLVTYDQLMNHARASREALMNVVGTYVKIKMKKSLAADFHFRRKGIKLFFLIMSFLLIYQNRPS